MIEAYPEQLITIDEMRSRMPQLRAREAGLRAQLGAAQAQAADRDAYLQLAGALEGFLTRLRSKTATASTGERRRVLKLLVKDVLIAREDHHPPPYPCPPAPPPSPSATRSPTRRVTIAQVAKCVGGVSGPPCGKDRGLS
jgi:hypothetical protein